jgi:hypothetical protein
MPAAFYSQKYFLVLISVRVSLPSAIMRLEGLGQLKTPMKSCEIRLVHITRLGVQLMAPLRMYRPHSVQGSINSLNLSIVMTSAVKYFKHPLDSEDAI